MKKDENNFAFIHLFAALLVVLGHQYALVGHGLPEIFHMDISKLGVRIIFVISGYLVTESYRRSRNTIHYLHKRFVRIYPPLILCMILTVCGIGAIFTTYSIPEYFRGSGDYLIKNILLYPIFRLPGVFEDNMYPAVVNGSLWSLPVEMFCYVLLIGLMKIYDRVHTEKQYAAKLFYVLFCCGIWVIYTLRVTGQFTGSWIVWGTDWFDAVQLIALFVFGSLFSVLKLEKLCKWWIAIPVGLAGMCIGGTFQAASFPLVITYVILSFAFMDTPFLAKCIKKNIAYGIYLWSFPIQQAMVEIWMVRGGRNFSPIAMFLLSMPLVAAAAYFSRILIEEPILKRFKEGTYIVNKCQEVGAKIKNLNIDRKSLLEEMILIGLTSAVVFYLVEAIYFQSFSSALEFIFGKETLGAKFLNLSIIILFQIFLRVMIRRMSICFCITSSAACILAIVNELKMNARGEAFTFDDIAVAREALLVAGNYDLKISGVDLCAIVLTLVMSILLAVFGPRKPSRQKESQSGRKKVRVRAAAAFGCLGIFLGVWTNVKTIMENMGKGNVYVASEYYDQNGFLVGLARTASNQISVPEGYSKQSIDAMLESIDVEPKGNTPNVIFIMNESLFDIGSAEGVSLSADPLERLKEMQREYTNGSFLSPTSGGGTCNVEFEVLTGCPMEEVGVTAMPYADMIRRRIDSLASLMNQNGYYTTAFHPNTGAYFNRRKVYGYMEFQDVFFTEEMGDLPLEGTYASDLELYQRVIEQYESEERAGRPFFSYIITIQNHGGYNYEYENGSIEVLDAGRGGDEQSLRTYANLASNSIEAFEYITDYFDNIDDPTVIVMFGDHCPGFAGDYDMLPEEEGVPNLLWYRTTPLIVYNNYGLPYEEWGYINGYALGAKVLEYCGISQDAFWAYGLEESDIPRLGENYYVNHKWVEENLVDSASVLHRKNVWMMAYDRLFGKEYYGN